MKVLLLNGSPHAAGVCSFLCQSAESVFTEAGVHCDTVQIGSLPMRGCMDCGFCKTHDRCIVEDEVNSLSQMLRHADGLLLVSPVYYASVNGNLRALLDRLFRSTADLSGKVFGGAVSARRCGGTDALSVLTNYALFRGMTVASGGYPAIVLASTAEEAEEDKEGLFYVRTLARNMVFLMRAIRAEAEKSGLPKKEPPVKTDGHRLLLSRGLGQQRPASAVEKNQSGADQ